MPYMNFLFFAILSLCFEGYYYAGKKSGCQCCENLPPHARRLLFFLHFLRLQVKGLLIFAGKPLVMFHQPLQAVARGIYHDGTGFSTPFYVEVRPAASRMVRRACREVKEAVRIQGQAHFRLRHRHCRHTTRLGHDAVACLCPCRLFRGHALSAARATGQGQGSRHDARNR